jgi:hypothetical protein
LVLLFGIFYIKKYRCGQSLGVTHVNSGLPLWEGALVVRDFNPVKEKHNSNEDRRYLVDKS